MPGGSRRGFSLFDLRGIAPGDTSESGANRGLSKREREAIVRENSGVFGGLFKRAVVEDLAADAQRRATNNGRRNTGSGRGSTRRARGRR